jgi:hypothetical protein
MEVVLLDVESLHLGISDLDALWVAVGVDVAGDGETSCPPEQVNSLARPVARLGAPSDGRKARTRTSECPARTPGGPGGKEELVNTETNGSR